VLSPEIEYIYICVCVCMCVCQCGHVNECACVHAWMHVLHVLQVLARGCEDDECSTFSNGLMVDQSMRQMYATAAPAMRVTVNQNVTLGICLPSMILVTRWRPLLLRWA
jgi:hypothetical protein